MNAATCTNAVNAYTCACVSDYTGTHYETGGHLILPNIYKHIIIKHSALCLYNVKHRTFG